MDVSQIPREPCVVTIPVSMEAAWCLGAPMFAVVTLVTLVETVTVTLMSAAVTLA